VAPKIQLWKPSQHFNGEGSMTHRETTDAMGHSGGVVIDCMVTKDVLSNWRDPPRPGQW
jgi:hypothetical protein